MATSDEIKFLDANFLGRLPHILAIGKSEGLVFDFHSNDEICNEFWGVFQDTTILTIWKFLTESIHSDLLIALVLNCNNLVFFIFLKEKYSDSIKRFSKTKDHVVS